MTDLQEFMRQAFGSVNKLPGWARLQGLAEVVGVVALLIAYTVTHEVLLAVALAVVVLAGLIGISTVTILALKWSPARAVPVRSSEAAPDDSPYTATTRADPAQRVRLMYVLCGAITTVADYLAGSTSSRTDTSLIRANIFAKCADGKARIVPGLHINMNHPPEFALQFDTREGSTGIALAQGRPNWVVAQDGWSRGQVGRPQESMLHPDLKWVLTWPIVCDGAIVWILNVDGLIDIGDDDSVVEGALKNLGATLDALHVEWEAKQVVRH